MNKNLKNAFQLASNILIYVISVLLLLSVWLGYMYFCIATITMIIVAFILLFFSKDKLTASTIFSDLNLYYYIVAFIIALSKLNGSNNLFYIGIALFAIVLVVYILIAFVFKTIRKKK